MRALGHITVGAILGIVLVDPDITLISAVIFASLLPDIDHPKSTLGRYNPVARFMHHRGFTHTITGAIVISLPFTYVSDRIWWCIFIGCMGHILADKMASLLPGRRRFRIKLW